MDNKLPPTYIPYNQASEQLIWEKVLRDPIIYIKPIESINTTTAENNNRNPRKQQFSHKNFFLFSVSDMIKVIFIQSRM